MTGAARLPNGVRLAYEIRGSGRPVLLIAGLARDRRMWDAQFFALAERFQVLRFDNRGVGGSSRPAGPYTALGMAEDAACLLDELGLTGAHVVGASLGGMIAQELALSFPRKVSSLALLCTSPGMPHAVPMSSEVWKAMQPDPCADPFQRVFGALALAYSRAYRERRPDAIAAEARSRLADAVPEASWWSQAAAGMSFSHRGRRLRCPTLIMTGEEDVIVPAANAEVLRQLIEGARLLRFPNGGHYFFVEQPEAVNAELVAFVESTAGAPA